ncbi:MAG: ADOP family duplicated permease [Gemmatimonadales bacterium]
MMRRLFRFAGSARDVPRDVRSEIGFHIEMRAQEFIDAGMAPQAARLAAAQAFGDVDAIETECRKSAAQAVRARTRRMTMNELVQDLQYGFRTLRKSPGFAFAAILTLALGIGANTAVFSMIRGVLLRPLPYRDGQELVILRQPASLVGVPDAGFSAKEVEDYRGAGHSLQGVAEYHSMPFILLGRGEPRRVQTGVVSANFFDLMGVRPALGRTFRPGEDAVGATPVLVLSYGFWKSELGGDPAIVGRTFEMNDRIHTVIGVLPPVPQYPNENDVYMPISSCPFRSAPAVAENRSMRMVKVFGRLTPGTSLAGAQSELETIASRLHAAYPEAYASSQGFGINAAPLQEELTVQARPTLMLLFATAVFVLLIACANVANLTLARLVRRERELALRTALGADRRRLLRQLLVEGTLLSLAGGVIGLGLAGSVLRLLTAYAARFTPRAAEISIDGSVLAFTLVVSLLTGVAFGVLPALPSKLNLVGSLKDGGAATSGGRSSRIRAALVVAQVAVSVVLLVGAGLLVRSLRELQRVDPGFVSDNVLTMTLDLNWSRYTTNALVLDFHRRLQARLADQAGIVSSASSLSFPLSGVRPFGFQFQIEGRPADKDGSVPLADFRSVSPGYFPTLGIPLISGRSFTEDDAPGSPEVVLINQSLARKYWGTDNPLGHRITTDSGKTWNTIVGVVGDVRQYSLDAGPADEMYAPFAQSPVRQGVFLVRTTADPIAVGKRVADAVHALDPGQPVAKLRTLEQLRSDSLASPRLTALLLTLFSLLALVITCAGLAGVIAFSVSQRSQEIGVRMALGAARGEVLGMVVLEGMRLVAGGLVLGVVGALLLTRLMTAHLFNVEATDPVTFVLTTMVLVAVAVAACLIPARRAASVDPIVALRST